MSDHELFPKISATHSALYGKAYKQHTRDIAKVLFHALPLCRKLLDFDPDVKIVIKPMRGNTLGMYNSFIKTVRIDPRIKNPQEIVESLCHELVHAEQFHQGRMTSAVNEGKLVVLWNGVVCYNKGMTYVSYRKQPWEVEAFSRQKELADLVLKSMKDVLNSLKSYSLPKQTKLNTSRQSFITVQRARKMTASLAGQTFADNAPRKNFFDKYRR